MPDISELKSPQRRLPVGAEAQPGGGVHFRTWAPAFRHVALMLGEKDDCTDASEIPLTAEPGGYWSSFVQEACAGMHYRYRLKSGVFPDVASRFQPSGPHGASRIIDPSAYSWSDSGWQGVGPHGHIIYEMHIGTFTSEGTWSAAAARLPYLAGRGFSRALWVGLRRGELICADPSIRGAR